MLFKVFKIGLIILIIRKINFTINSTIQIKNNFLRNFNKNKFKNKMTVTNKKMHKSKEELKLQLTL